MMVRPPKTLSASPTSSSSISPLSSDLVRKSLYIPFGIAALYLAFFFALLTPFFQRQFIFLHSIRFPFFPTFTDPAKYGLAPFKARNLVLTTSDGEKIGAWHILPEPFYQAQMTEPLQNNQQKIQELHPDLYAKALKEFPTIIYLHGNAMNRAAPFRIAAYTALTSRIDANVVAIDYRGFGDSTGSPSEEGLTEDAHTAWRYIRSHQGQSHSTDASSFPPITVFGQSLGTGIAALLAARLEREDTPLENVVLMAPYANLKSLVKDYRLGGILPILAPLKAIPGHDFLLDTFMKTHLNTLKNLPRVLLGRSRHPSSKVPRKNAKIVLLHATDDPVIPVFHSHMLFDRLLQHSDQDQSVEERDIDGFAKIRRFKAIQGKQENSVTFIQTNYGGHNQLSEGALDLVRLACQLPSAFVER